MTTVKLASTYEFGHDKYGPLKYEIMEEVSTGQSIFYFIIYIQREIIAYGDTQPYRFWAILTQGYRCQAGTLDGAEQEAWNHFTQNYP